MRSSALPSVGGLGNSSSVENAIAAEYQFLN